MLFCPFLGGPLLQVFLGPLHMGIPGRCCLPLGPHQLGGFPQPGRPSWGPPSPLMEAPLPRGWGPDLAKGPLFRCWVLVLHALQILQQRERRQLL